MGALEIPDGFELVDVPLSGVGFKRPALYSKRFDDGRVTEFYEAEPDQFVKAYVNGRAGWAAVAGFSIHRNIKVVIINLRNGCQIISDHDPRAVFGTLPGSMEVSRFYPDEALVRGVLVPCEVPLGLRSWTGPMVKCFHGLWDALNEKARLLTEDRLGSRVRWLPEEGLWELANHDLSCCGENPPVPELAALQWTGIESVVHTGVVETGYDLTVPGYETFMAVDGVILSNTMNAHVPVLQETVEEAKNVLMPSKMPFSIRNPDKIMPTLKHEQVLGYYDAMSRPAAKTWKFDSEDEAMEAVRSGAVPLEDEIEIPD